ncbi:hypothetical protein [Kitasatospora griseola]|uniref:hypothetical protein n=1 Tax=Kitasatospora griseola TaxID=2064 RepID=UPI00128DD7F6|nr:hypothetical protein [Kitasatospora griseola]
MLVVLVVVAEAVLVVEFVVFLGEEPAAVDAGEEVFEEVGRGPPGIERGQAQAGVLGVGVRAGVLGEIVVDVFELFAQAGGSGRRPSAMWRAWRTRPVTASYGEVPASRSWSGGRGWGFRGGRASMLSASRSTAVGECPVAPAVTSAVGYGDSGGGGVGLGEQCRGAEGVLFEELVGGGDLEGGGAFAAEEDGLAGAAGEVAEFGAPHGDCFDVVLVIERFGGAVLGPAVLVGVGGGLTEQVGAVAQDQLGEAGCVRGGQHRFAEAVPDEFGLVSAARHVLQGDRGAVPPQ